MPEYYIITHIHLPNNNVEFDFGLFFVIVM